MTECARCKEHEQFRHQHRDCDSLAVENQALRLRVAKLSKQLDIVIADARRYALGSVSNTGGEHGGR